MKPGRVKPRIFTDFHEYSNVPEAGERETVGSSLSVLLVVRIKNSSPGSPRCPQSTRDGADGEDEIPRQIGLGFSPFAEEGDLLLVENIERFVTEADGLGVAGSALVDGEGEKFPEMRTGELELVFNFVHERLSQ